MTEPAGAIGREPKEQRSSSGSCLGLALLLCLAAAGFIGLVFYNFSRPKAQGALTHCKSNLKNIGTALEMWSSDHKGRYPAQLDMLTPRYLRSLPQCIEPRKMTYVYELSADGKDFSVFCSGDNHARAYGAFKAPSRNYPYYRGSDGLHDHP